MIWWNVFQARDLRSLPKSNLWHAVCNLITPPDLPDSLSEHGLAVLWRGRLLARIDRVQRGLHVRARGRPEMALLVPASECAPRRTPLPEAQSRTSNKAKECVAHVESCFDCDFGDAPFLPSKSGSSAATLSTFMVQANSSSTMPICKHETNAPRSTIRLKNSSRLRGGKSRWRWSIPSFSRRLSPLEPL
jgi:hypothetical protein